MDEKKQRIPTQVRMTESLHEAVRRVSEKTCGNINSTMCHLIAAGIRAYEGNPSIRDEAGSRSNQ
jgi:hypothetical protein